MATTVDEWGGDTKRVDVEMNQTAAWRICSRPLIYPCHLACLKRRLAALFVILNLERVLVIEHTILVQHDNCRWGYQSNIHQQEIGQLRRSQIRPKDGGETTQTPQSLISFRFVLSPLNLASCLVMAQAGQSGLIF